MTTPYSVPEGAKLADGSAPEKHAPRRLAIEDVPDKNLRSFLRWDISTSKFNMGCFLTLTCLGPIPWMFLFFSAITNSLIIGGVLATANLFQIPVALSIKNGNPAALAFYVANPEAAKRIGETCKANVISTCILSTVIGVLSWIYLFEPWSQNGIFGVHSYTIVAAIHWTGVVCGPASGFFNQIGASLPKEVSIIWNKKITTYLEQVVEELLDVEAGCANVMARIAAHQSETEDFARGMSIVLAGINGGMTADLACSVFIMTGAIAIPSEATGSERGIQIGLLSAISLFTMTFLITFLRAMTSANHHWESEKKRLLNDARISNLVGPRVYQWDNFHVWLEGHELSAFKAFGIRVTSQLLRNVGSLLVSTFAIVLYILLREELRGFLA